MRQLVRAGSESLEIGERKSGGKSTGIASIFSNDFADFPGDRSARPRPTRCRRRRDWIWSLETMAGSTNRIPEWNRTLRTSKAICRSP